MSAATGPSAVWAYAVAERVRLACLDKLEGVGGGRVRAVAAAGLTAIAGDVSLAEFGEAALRRNLENLAWLEATARAHHQVIETVAGEGPVVPMRLATVYRDDARRRGRGRGAGRRLPGRAGPDQGAQGMGGQGLRRPAGRARRLRPRSRAGRACVRPGARRIRGGLPGAAASGAVRVTSAPSATRWPARS